MAISLPAVPPFLTTPRVDSRIAQNIQVYLDTNLGWADRIYHIARAGKDKEQKGDYPQISANDGSDTNYNIRPDNSIGSYAFFEVDQPFRVDYENDEITCFFSIVFWNNLKLIDPGKQYDYTSELIKDVLDKLQTFSAQGVEVETRPERIFDKYSGLQQELKQHLMRQYSGFKISFETTQPFTDNCSPSPIDSCAQNVARINALPSGVKACVVAAISECPVCPDPPVCYSILIENFLVSDNGDIATITWESLKESGISYYMLEGRASESDPWTFINFIGATGVGSNYSYQDDPSTLPFYYRLSVGFADDTVFVLAQNVICPTVELDTFLNFVFGVGATADYSTTIVAGEEGAYTANALTNCADPVYYVNGVADALPFTLVAGDTLRVTCTITNTAIESRVKITGTYV